MFGKPQESESKHMDRRDFTSGCALVLASSVLGPLDAEKKTTQTGEKEYTAPADGGLDRDEWLLKATIAANRNSYKKTSGLLVFSRFKDRIYVLQQPMSWSPTSLIAEQHGYPDVTVPKGFVTDLASIPRIFYSLLPPDGDYTVPAIIHDYLYWTQTTTRNQADNILRFSMQDYKIGPITRTVIYNAVHVGGGSAWTKNTEFKKEKGEKRVLTQLPQDSSTTWQEWKRDPAHFS